MRNMAELNARAVKAQRILQAPLDRAIVALFFHVDEVDDDQACKVAQFDLACDFVGGFKVGVDRGFFN